jgi:hypothetical protein
MPKLSDTQDISNSKNAIGLDSLLDDTLAAMKKSSISSLDKVKESKANSVFPNCEVDALIREFKSTFGNTDDPSIQDEMPNKIDEAINKLMEMVVNFFFTHFY